MIGCVASVCTCVCAWCSVMNWCSSDIQWSLDRRLTRVKNLWQMNKWMNECKNESQGQLHSDTFCLFQRNTTNDSDVMSHLSAFLDIRCFPAQQFQEVTERNYQLGSPENDIPSRACLLFALAPPKWKLKSWKLADDCYSKMTSVRHTRRRLVCNASFKSCCLHR